MKTRILLIIMISFVSVGMIKAQVLTKAQDSITGTNIESLVYDYTRYGNLTENDMDISQRYVQQFSNLFTENAYLYNDILGSNYPPMVSVRDYIRGVIAQYPTGLSLSVSIQTIKPAKWYDKAQQWIIPVNVVKDVYTLDKNSNEVKMQLEETLEVVFSKDLSNPRIDRITEKQIDLVDVTFSFVDIEKSEALKNIAVNLKYEGKVQQKKVTNANGVVYFTNVPPENQVTIFIDEGQGYSSENIPVITMGEWSKKDEKDRKIFLQRYKQWKKIGMEAYFQPVLSQTGWTAAEDNYTSSSVSVNAEMRFNAGFNMWYYFKADDKKALGLGLGINLDNYSSAIDMTNYDQSPLPQKNPDADQDQYSLLVQSESISDKIDMSFVSIPVLFKYRKSLNMSIFSYWYVDAGIKLSYLMSSSSGLNGSVNYAGYYPEWDITIQDIAYLGYGDQQVNYKSDLELNSMLLSATASTGLYIPIKKPGLYFSIGLDVIYGLNNLSTYDPAEYYLSDGIKSYQSLAGSSKAIKPYSFGGRIGIYYDLHK